MFLCCSEKGPEAELAEPFEKIKKTRSGYRQYHYDYDKHVSGLVHLPASFEVDGAAPLREPPLRSGTVWFLQTKSHDGPLQDISRVVLSVHLNGMRIKYLNREKAMRTLAWSPFTVVQANRFHAPEGDESWPRLRLFKVSDFQNGVSCLFLVSGQSSEDAILDRARWITTIACSIRMLTLSLFPMFNVQTTPNSLQWTQTRVLAGHMLLFDLKGVTPVYCELHAPVHCTTSLMAYEDDSCTCLLTTLLIDPESKIVERLGVDSSCFTLNEHHFAARTVAEKTLWIRAISNVKVKLRHAVLPTSDLELQCYRNAVEEQIEHLPSPRLPSTVTKEARLAPLLRRRAQHAAPETSNPATSVLHILHAPRTPSAASHQSEPDTPPAGAKVAVAV